MKREHGLTLIELLVGLSLIAIVMGVGVSSFKPFFVKRAATAAADTLAMDYRLARSEAVRRTSSVTICRSINGASCATGEGSWHEGWLVFSDANADHAINGNDEILRAQGQVQGVTGMHNGTEGETKYYTTFRPTGLAVASAESIIATADRTVAGGTRLLCISALGRASLRAPGVAANSC